MIKPSSHFDKNRTDTESPERSRTPDSKSEASQRSSSMEESRKKLEAALEHVNRKFGRTLRKLAE